MKKSLCILIVMVSILACISTFAATYESEIEIIYNSSDGTLSTSPDINKFAWVGKASSSVESNSLGGKAPDDAYTKFTTVTTKDAYMNIELDSDAYSKNYTVFSLELYGNIIPIKCIARFSSSLQIPVCLIGSELLGDSWNSISIVFEKSTRDIDLFINGKYIKSDNLDSAIKGYNYADYNGTIPMFRFVMFKRGATSYYDNVSAYKSDTYPSFNVPFVKYSHGIKKASITNYKNELIESIIIFANYDDNKLNDVYTEAITLVPGENEITATNFSQNIGSNTKVMLWDPKTLKPLCSPFNTKITRTIRVAGDSISAKWPADRYGQQGWGEPFKNEWTDDVVVLNDAVSGWTTEKYYNEKWTGIKAEMNPGDYLIVSYLHNDYYVPIKDTSKTDYINTYKGYLEKLIKETKEIGVNIVLVVPPNRGVQGNFHGDFSFVMPALAEEYDVPCIDVHAKTIEMLDNDLEGTKQLLYMYKLVEQGIITEEQLANHTNATLRTTGEDLTHLSTQGAAWIADYIASHMAEVISELKVFVK